VLWLSIQESGANRCKLLSAETDSWSGIGFGRPLPKPQEHRSEPDMPVIVRPIGITMTAQPIVWNRFSGTGPTV